MITLTKTEKQYFVEKSFESCKNDLIKTGIKFHKRPIEVAVSKRCRRSLGICYTNYEGELALDHRIVIADFLFDGATDWMELKKRVDDTMMHELIHTVYPGDGHGSLFKEAGALINKFWEGKYLITVVEGGTSCGSAKTAKYFTVCPECGYEKGYKIRTKAWKEAESHVCPECGQAFLTQEVR